MPRDTYPLTECKHTESEVLFPGVCMCGKLSLPDPSWFFLGAAAVLFVAHAIWWIAL